MFFVCQQDEVCGAGGTEKVSGAEIFTEENVINRRVIFFWNLIILTYISITLSSLEQEIP